MENLYCKQKDKVITIIEGETKTLINMEEITYLNHKNDCTMINTLHKLAIKNLKPLSYFENELKEFGFIKANCFTLINTKNINCIHFGSIRSVVLSNNVPVKISRRNLHLFKALIKNSN